MGVNLLFFCFVLCVFEQRLKKYLLPHRVSTHRLPDSLKSDNLSVKQRKGFITLGILLYFETTPSSSDLKMKKGGENGGPLMRHSPRLLCNNPLHINVGPPNSADCFYSMPMLVAKELFANHLDRMHSLILPYLTSIHTYTPSWFSQTSVIHKEE